MSAPSRKPNESVMQFYKRLKDGVADGTLDLEKSEIYMLLFGENVSADHARKCLRTLDMTLEIEGNTSLTQASAADADDTPNKTSIEIKTDGIRQAS